MTTPRCARDLMSSPVISLPRAATVREAAHILLDNRLSGAPVVDEAGKPVGVFSFRDMAKYFLDPALETGGTGTAGMAKISELMTPKIQSVRPEATIEECRRAMRQHKTHRMLVQDAGGKIVGIISASDLGLGLRTHE
ncbi:MAG: CBS domain-containing protein [Planctomycetes bacterium]|nr:CBS domain-containing protein [Planctomycetota bacterium]